MDASSREARRDYNVQYDRDNRDHLREKARERYRARIKRVSAGVLRAAREDPRYEEKHAIRGHVICRVSDCGAKAERLTPAHLRCLHGLTTAQYRTNFPGAPMQSLALCEKQSADMRRAPRRLPRVPGHPGEEPLRTWLIVEGASRGKTSAEISRDVDRHRDTVRRLVHDLSLGPPRLYDLGMPVTNAYVLRLLKATGLGSREFAESFGTSRILAAEILRPRAAHHRVSPSHARSIIAARDRLIREIAGLARNTAHRWGPNQTRLLRSMVPDFRLIHWTLRKGLSLTRGLLRMKPAASITDWQDWLCRGASVEIERGLRVRPFAAFLPLAAEVSQFIEPHLDALRRRGLVRNVAARILAARFGVPPSCCIRDDRRARPLSPRDVRHWILETTHSHSGAASGITPQPHVPEKTPRKHGPEKMPFPHTKAFQIGEEVGQLVAAGTSRTDGRKQIARKYGFEFDTVRRYDQRYLRQLTSKLG